MLTLCVSCSLCTDPFSVRPASPAPPVAGKPFSLQCVGSENPASITWLRNKRPMPASERVHFSPDNTTMTFSPLLQADGGLYQCVVAEGGTPMQSVGYEMQVNCECLRVITVTSLRSKAAVSNMLNKLNNRREGKLPMWITRDIKWLQNIWTRKETKKYFLSTDKTVVVMLSHAV